VVEEALDASEDPALHHVDVAAGIGVLDAVHVPGRASRRLIGPVPTSLRRRLLVVPGPFEQADQNPPRVHFFMALAAARRLGGWGASDGHARGALGRLLATDVPIARAIDVDKLAGSFFIGPCQAS
jgi:hypothetical protein